MEGYSLLISHKGQKSFAADRLIFNAGLKRKQEQDAAKETSAKQARPGPDDTGEKHEASETSKSNPATPGTQAPKAVSEKQTPENHPTENEEKDGGRSVEFKAKDGSTRTVHFNQKQSSPAKHGSSGNESADQQGGPGGPVQPDVGEGGAEPGPSTSTSTSTAPSSNGNQATTNTVQE